MRTTTCSKTLRALSVWLATAGWLLLSRATFAQDAPEPLPPGYPSPAGYPSAEPEPALPLQPAKPHTASVPPAVMAARLGLRALLSFGGDVQGELDGVLTPTADLALGYGGFATVDLPLHRLFSIGLDLGAFSWNTESGVDSGFGRSTLLELLLRPRVRFPLILSGDRIIELYGVIPIGPNLIFLTEDSVNPGVSLTPKAGISIGVAAGVAYWLSHEVAIAAEVGTMHHSLTSKVAGEDTTFDLDMSLSHWGLSLGMMLAL